MRKITILLCVSLILSGAAYAAAGDALIAHGGSDDYIRSICAIGDTLYMLGYRDGVYAYDSVAGATELFAWNDEYIKANDGILDADGERVYRTIYNIFAWKDELYALATTSSVESGVIDVELCRVNMQNGVASIENAGEIDWESGAYEDYFQIQNCVVVGDVLCGNIYMSNDFLCFMPLDGSDMLVTDITRALLCAYGDKLMAITEQRGDGRSYVFYEVDPQTGEHSELARLDSDKYIVGAAWSPEEEKVLFVRDKSLVSFDIETGATETITPIPFGINGPDVCVLRGGLYAALGYDGVIVRRISGREAAACELVIAEQLNTGAVEETVIAYISERPDVSVTRMDAENILDQLLTHSNTVDIFVLRSKTSRESVLDAVLARGWAADIDSELLENAVNEMYPALSERLMRDGKLIGVPLKARAFGLGVNVGGLKALNQTMDDVPTNWADFCDYMGGLTDNDIVPVIGEGDANQAPVNLLDRLIEDYALEIASGRQTSYDTPEFQQALDAFERLDFEAMEENGLDIDYDGNPLISYYELTGLDGSMYDDEYDYYPLRLSISADDPVYMPIQAEIAIINPASENIEEAVKFLEAAWEKVDAITLAMLCPSAQQPLYNTEAYESNAAAQRERIEKLKEQIESYKGDAQPLIEELEFTQDVLLQMENWYWTISQPSLDWYQAHDDNVALETDGELGDMNLHGLLWKHVESGESVEALLAEIEQMSRMKRLEGA